MTIDKNYTEKLCNTVAETIVGAFERITIDDVNMYKLGYNKAIDDFKKEMIRSSLTEREKEYIRYKAEQLKEGGTDANDSGCEVIAWQPLPELYKESEKE